MSSIVHFVLLAFAVLFSHHAHALDRAVLPLNAFVRSLWIENHDTSVATLWISGPEITAGEPRERSFEFAAGERTQLPVDSFQNQPWILLKTAVGPKLKVHVVTESLDVTELPWGLSNSYTDTVAPTGLPLYLTNPNPFPVSGKLILGPKTLPFRIDPEAVLKMSVVTPTLVNVEVKAEHRVGALWMGERKLRRPALTTVALPFVQSPPGRFFLLENGSRTQSFIAELQDPVVIAQALNQIARPNAFLPRILIAQAQLTHNSVNRDWQHPSRAPWNWSVQEVFRFADFAMQECDGSPEFLDEILPYWLSGGGLICFWNYKVTRELTPEQVTTGRD
jgi:hypothetical protein